MSHLMSSGNPILESDTIPETATPRIGIASMGTLNPAPSAMPPEPLPGDRLNSWKEIAAYLKRDVRTLHRWEIEESLPIHRHPHKKRDSVYAYRTELDMWRNERHRRLDRRGGHFVGHWNVALGELARQIAESLRLRLTPEDEKRLAKRST